MARRRREASARARAVTARRLWDRRHREVPVEELSWFQSIPVASLSLLDRLAVRREDGVIDVGGGVSPLAGALLDRGFGDITVLDVSKEALDAAAGRLPAAAGVCWIVADVTTWRPSRTWDVWHDRAVFHFLTAAEARAAYLRALSEALAERGGLVIGTFAPDGPDHCSGLPTERYDADSLVHTIRSAMPVDAVDAMREVHVTPNGVEQPYTWVACRRRR
jgi:SAM-dependent methyltransferase